MKLSDYMFLEDGWDGETSKAHSHDTIKAALLFVQQLPKNINQPKPMLSSSDEVGVYWNTEKVY